MIMKVRHLMTAIVAWMTIIHRGLLTGREANWGSCNITF